MLDFEEIEHRKMKGKFRDWRKALSKPTTYRVGNAVRVQPKFILFISFVFSLLMFISYYYIGSVQPLQLNNNMWSNQVRTYNSTYPLSKPIVSGDIAAYRIGLIADLDTNSKSKSGKEWFSYLKMGYLNYNHAHNAASVAWDSETVILKSGYSLSDRGMELSDLVIFDGKFLSFDDRSGMEEHQPALSINIVKRMLLEPLSLDLLEYDGYRNKYPLSDPVTHGQSVTYRIGTLCDLDSESRKGTARVSYFKQGQLQYNSRTQRVSVSWECERIIETGYRFGERGAELSELLVFDEKLLAFDDKTGLIFELVGNKAVPWVVLADGNGKVDKGFKIEWATVKQETLYVGSIGKEWTTPEGEFVNKNPMWVKSVDRFGVVTHIDWVKIYRRLRESIGIKWPGYIIHEAVNYAHSTDEWVFLPRKCSHEAYNETNDESMGCNHIIYADENFTTIHSSEILTPKPRRGFSAFKFIPGTNEQAIVALRTSEVNGKTSTYISAFKRNGEWLMPETWVANEKYEGIEFI